MHGSSACLKSGMTVAKDIKGYLVLLWKQAADVTKADFSELPLADTSPVRTPCCYRQELKSQRIKTIVNNSRYYGLPRHETVVPRMSFVNNQLPHISSFLGIFS